MLDPIIFQQITIRYYTTEVDLFATRLNHQVPQYVARYPDPGALATDDFLQDWSGWTVFIHPPIVLIPRIFMQMKQDKATGLLISPHWHGKPWFPNLMEMLNVGGLSSTITTSPSDNFPSTRPRGSTPIVENPAISGMANFRSRLETA